MKKYIFGENSELILKKDSNNMFIISVGLKRDIQIPFHSLLSSEELSLLASKSEDELVPTIYCNFNAYTHTRKDTYGEDADNQRGINVEELIIDSIEIESLKLEVTTDNTNNDLCIEKNLLDLDKSLVKEFESIIQELCENNKINLD